MDHLQLKLALYNKLQIFYRAESKTPPLSDNTSFNGTNVEKRY